MINNLYHESNIHILEYKDGFITIERVKHNGRINLEYKNYKNSYIGYTLDNAIKDFKKLYERFLKDYERLIF